jgi:hypothetical protein
MRHRQSKAKKAPENRENSNEKGMKCNENIEAKVMKGEKAIPVK